MSVFVGGGVGGGTRRRFAVASASLSADGLTLTITLNRAAYRANTLDGSTPPYGWSLTKVAGMEQIQPITYVSGLGSKVWVFTVGSIINAGDVLKFYYTGGVLAAVLNGLPLLRDQIGFVVNNVPAVVLATHLTTLGLGGNRSGLVALGLGF